MKIKLFAPTLLLISIAVCGCSDSKKLTHKVNFKEDKINNHLTYFGLNTASNENDYHATFNIDYNYELLIENIHVSIDGKENNECWSFLYQTNEKNLFTINKEYITGDISINARATYRTSTPSEYGYLFDEKITQICDCRFMDNRQPKFIPTLDQVAYPVMEDDAIEVIMTLKDGLSYEGKNKEIMDNIWFRTNARYAKIEEDFSKFYSSDHRECHINVPHYIIRDHGSFQPNLVTTVEE